jgi:DNA polymerase
VLRERAALAENRIAPGMATYHPAFLLRNPENKRPVWNDLQQIMAKLGKEPPQKRRG